jgi:hypothetical protein
MLATEFELQGGLEDQLEEAAERERLLPGRMTPTSPAPRCPAHLLPSSQQRGLAVIADKIRRSQTAPAPAVRVTLVGHADLDPVRERQEPGFMGQRAEAVAPELRRRVGSVRQSREQLLRASSTGQTPVREIVGCRRANVRI